MWCNKIFQKKTQELQKEHRSFSKDTCKKQKNKNNKKSYVRSVACDIFHPLFLKNILWLFDTSV